MNKSRWAAGVMATFGATIYTAAHAAAAGSGESATLEEVIVTAEKRSENVQNVASTVTAVSAEVLIQQGVKDITDLARVAPEVTVQTGQFQNIGIRGVRTGAYGPSTDSPNAVHVDGVYQARFTGMTGFLYDLQRVEVLAGPQGTLYGRNATGGAINVITNKPNFDGTNGHVSVDYGNYNALNVNGAANYQVNDRLALRVAFLQNSRSGYNTDTGLDDTDMKAVRFSALFRPGDADSLLFTADHSQIGGKTQGAATNIETIFKDPSICTNTTTLAVALASAAGTCAAGSTFTQLALKRPDDPRHNLVFAGNSERARNDAENNGVLLQWDHSFSFATLTTELSHRVTYSHNTSGSFTGYQHDPRLFTAGVLRYAAPGFVPAHSAWDAAEVRLVSKDDKPLKWQVGLYNFHEKSDRNGNGSYVVTYPNPSAVAAGPLGSIYGQYNLVVDASGNNVVNSDINNELSDDKARAVFGQATWTPDAVPALHVTAGARYNWEEKHGIVHTVSPVTRQRIPAADVNDTRKWTKTTYKANVSYDIRPQNMIYIDHSTGFKSGGFAYGVNAAYNPEFLKSWEIGSKNRFLDNRLQVNFSAWDYDYTDQVTTIPQFYFDPVLVPVNGTGIANTITTVNAGNSKIKGQSLDIQWAVSGSDYLTVNVQHIDSKYNDFNLTGLYTRLNYFAWCTASPTGALTNGTCAGPVVNFLQGTSTTGDQSGPSVNYNGTRAGANPEWAGNLSYEHTFRGANAEWNAQVSYLYQGSRLNGNQQAPNTTGYFMPLDSYHTLDLSLRYRPAGAKWSVMLYGRNVTDELYRVARGFTSNNSAVQFNPANPSAVLSSINYGFTTAAYGPPRTFGIVFDTSF